MAIEFRCIRCGQRLRVPVTDQGNRARCPTCNAIVDIPTRDEPATPILMSREKSDVIDYELFGDDSQYVEITLDPGEVTVGRLQSLLYMTAGIATEKAATELSSNGGLLEKISQAGRRILTGSSLRMTAFCNVSEQREIVAFAPRTASRLVPIHLNEYGDRITCSGDAVLCAARGIEIRDADVDSLTDAAPMFHVTGDGIAVLQSSGQMFHRELKVGKQIAVRTASILAFTSEVTVSPNEPAGIEDQRSVSTLRGPGEIWLKTGE